MENVLKLKTWKLFLIIIFPWILSTLSDDYFIKDIFTILGYTIYFGFYLFVYEFILFLEKGKTTTIEIVFYYSVTIAYILMYAIVIIFYEENEPVVLRGINAVGGAIIYFISFFYIAFKPAQKLIQLEKKTFGRGKTESILVPLIALFLLPIGIWILMPKFKSLYSEIMNN